ncbi:MAG: zinc ABC transporter substrate-binding protein [Acetobacteraceae bacterium]|nr:zinc ABC transporter substrate-binding protein [Acetobacteraceae bacterium]
MQRRIFLAGLGAMTRVAQAASPFRAVVSFSVLADMLRQVAGDITIVTLVPPDGDVHVYQPRPGDLRDISDASLLVQNGLGLEGWMRRLAGAATFRGVSITATDGVMLRHVDGDIDPHAWQDPRNGVIYVRNIMQGMVKINPAELGAHRERAARYTTQIAAVDEWIAAQFATIPPKDRRIITTHDAFGYYGARYGIEFLAAEGISTDSEPSAKSIAALVAQIKREKIRAVFIENMTDPRLARMLARESGAILGGTVYSDSLSPPRGPAATYLEMLRHITTLFVRAMT